jgi:hypothetical protein
VVAVSLDHGFRREAYIIARPEASSRGKRDARYDYH